VLLTTVDVFVTSSGGWLKMGRSAGKNPAVLLEKIKESLDRLNEKMEVFIEIQRQERKGQDFLVQDLPEALDVMTLLSLPDHLRKTAVTICKLGHATAEEVAEQTKRARAVESGYLNQLVLMGYLKKERKGRKAFFFVEK
jgi:hypothetical protein